MAARLDTRSLSSAEKAIEREVARFEESGDLLKAYGDVFRASDVPASWVAFCEAIAPHVASSRGSQCIVCLGDLFDATSKGYGSELVACNPRSLAACLLSSSATLIPEASLIHGAVARLMADESPSACCKSLPGSEEAVAASSAALEALGVANAAARLAPSRSDGNLLGTVSSMLQGLALGFVGAVPSGARAAVCCGQLSEAEASLRLVLLPRAKALAEALELSLQALPCAASILVAARADAVAAGPGPTATGAYLLVEAAGPGAGAGRLPSGLGVLGRVWHDLATGGAAGAGGGGLGRHLRAHVQPVEEETAAAVLAGVVACTLRVAQSWLPACGGSPAGGGSSSTALCVVAARHAGQEVAGADALLAAGASHLGQAQALECRAQGLRAGVRARVRRALPGGGGLGALPGATGQFVRTSLRHAKALEALSTRLQRAGDACWSSLEARSAVATLREATRALSGVEAGLSGVGAAVEENDEALAEALRALDEASDAMALPAAAGGADADTLEAEMAAVLGADAGDARSAGVEEARRLEAALDAAGSPRAAAGAPDSAASAVPSAAASASCATSGVSAMPEAPVARVAQPAV